MCARDFHRRGRGLSLTIAGARRRLAVLASLALLAGCGQNVCLVGAVPPPPFGTPRGAGAGLAASELPVAAVAAGGRVQWTPTVTERRWRYIIIHHSATPTGDAAKFDADHRARGWDELGYHFVIGNGTLSGNGQLEVGSRWRKQKHGAHCKVRGHEEYNQLGIGICLVGHFNEERPSEAQMRRLAKLVRGLMQRYRIPKSRVLGHGMLAPTDCPGTLFDFGDLYRRL